MFVHLMQLHQFIWIQFCFFRYYSTTIIFLGEGSQSDEWKTWKKNRFPVQICHLCCMHWYFLLCDITHWNRRLYFVVLYCCQPFFLSYWWIYLCYLLVLFYWCFLFKSVSVLFSIDSGSWFPLNQYKTYNPLLLSIHKTPSSKLL